MFIYIEVIYIINHVAVHCVLDRHIVSTRGDIDQCLDSLMSVILPRIETIRRSRTATNCGVIHDLNDFDGHSRQNKNGYFSIPHNNNVSLLSSWLVFYICFDNVLNFTCFLIDVYDFQSTIQYSLKDTDISIRKRALDLLYTMCDEVFIIVAKTFFYWRASCDTLKRVLWYYEDCCVVLWRGRCGTLKIVMWYFENGGVVLWRV